MFFPCLYILGNLHFLDLGNWLKPQCAWSATILQSQEASVRKASSFTLYSSLFLTFYTFVQPVLLTGFVTFKSEADASRACQEMNDQDLDGRRIRVDIQGAQGGKGKLNSSMCEIQNPILIYMMIF